VEGPLSHWGIVSPVTPRRPAHHGRRSKREALLIELDRKGRRDSWRGNVEGSLSRHGGTIELRGVDGAHLRQRSRGGSAVRRDRPAGGGHPGRRGDEGRGGAGSFLPHDCGREKERKEKRPMRTPLLGEEHSLVADVLPGQIGGGAHSSSRRSSIPSPRGDRGRSSAVGGG